MKKVIFSAILATVFFGGSAYASINHDDINTAFRFILGREANSGDKSFWQNSDLATLQKGLVNSTEYKNNTKDYVVDMYLTLLSRYPDYDGATFWQTRGPLEMYRGIKNSTEFKAFKDLAFSVSPTNAGIPNPIPQTQIVFRDTTDFDGVKNVYGSEYFEDFKNSVATNDVYYISSDRVEGAAYRVEGVKATEYQDSIEFVYTLRKIEVSDGEVFYPFAFFLVDKTSASKKVNFKYIRSDYVDSYNQIKG